MSNNYWKEALDCALDEAGVFDKLNEEEKLKIAKDLQFAAEMESESCGYLNIPNPLNTEIDNLKKKMKDQEDKFQKREWIYQDSIAQKFGGKDRVHVSIRDGMVEVEARR